MLSNRRPSSKIALFERSEFAILEGRDLENINFWNKIFGQELFVWLRLDQISARNFDKSAFLYSHWIRFFISSCIAKARIG